MTKYILIFLLSFSAQSDDIWEAGYGKDHVIANGTQCFIVTHVSDYEYADETPNNITNSRMPRDMTDQQRLNCDKVMLAAANDTIKILPVVLKAVPSKNGTRPTRDATTALIKLKIRVPDTVLCEGAIIKKYRKNSNWYRVKRSGSSDPNVATLCGMY